MAGKWIVEENYDLSMCQEWYEIYTVGDENDLKFLCNDKEHADWLCGLLNKEDNEQSC